MLCNLIFSCECKDQIFYSTMNHIKKIKKEDNKDYLLETNSQIQIKKIKASSIFFILLTLLVFVFSNQCQSKKKDNAVSSGLATALSTAASANPSNLGGCGFSKTNTGGTTYYLAPINVISGSGTVSFSYNSNMQTYDSVVQVTASANQKIYISSLSTIIGYGSLNVYFASVSTVACPINLNQYTSANSSSSLALSYTGQTSITLSPPASGGSYGIFLEIIINSNPTDIKVVVQ